MKKEKREFLSKAEERRYNATIAEQKYKENVKDAQQMLADGMSIPEIAEKTNKPEATVRGWVL